MGNSGFTFTGLVLFCVNFRDKEHKVFFPFENKVSISEQIIEDIEKEFISFIR